MKVKIFRATEGYQVKDFLQYARDHMVASDILFRINRPSLFDSAGYLCHLGFELLFKAWILHRNNQFEATHDLERLLSSIQTFRPSLKLSKKRRMLLHSINSYTNLRYPLVSNPVEIGNEEWMDIYSMWIALVKIMPLECKRQIKSISVLNKGGRILMEKSIKT